MRNRTAAGCLCLGAAGLLLAACSEATKYRVLSFFLDGVPKPASLVEARSPEDQEPLEAAALPEVAPRPATLQRFFTHRPYADGRCGGCHNATSGELLRPIREGLCLTCHADIAKGRYVHGPVAVNGCDLCHLHHNAQLPKLLLRDPVATCLYCHDGADLAEVEQHEAAGEQGCTECHDPHHGEVRFFLSRGAP